MAEDLTIKYSPAGPTLKAFHQSDAFVRGLMGPIGSGKSTACAVELVKLAGTQTVGPDGIRRSRFAIIRNTYPELKATTIKTWEQWIPRDLGRFAMDPPITHHIRADGMDVEVMFLALDREEDQRKLLSLELSAAWINEAREVPKAILDTLTGRVGRFPSSRQGGCRHPCVIMDTNAPDTEHWWFRLAEGETPEDWEFFRQPSGDNSDAENTENLPPRYYERAVTGKDDDWIKVYVRGEYGFVQDGKPVFPAYRDGVHVAPETIPPVVGLPLLVGCDFGLTPAAIICQHTARGQWLVLDELVTEDTGAVRFAELLSAYLAQNYPGMHVDGYGDPAGEARAQTDERTVLEIMREYTGYRWLSAPSNDWTMRREAVTTALNRLIDGTPGLLLSPKCVTLRKGFVGGYHFRAVKAAGSEMYHQKPVKNRYSHPHDALQYALLGGGEYRVVLRRNERPAWSNPIIMDTDFNVFA